MTIKYKKLDVNAKCPERVYEDAAAWDVYATSKKLVDNKDHGYIEYGTGLALEIPPNHVLKIFPRGSISKTGLILANSVGLLDSDYRGELFFRYKWIPNTKQYEIGEKIGQVRLEVNLDTEWELTDTLSETERGEGRFGSSDDIKSTK